jgi:hypothetical protein
MFLVTAGLSHFHPAHHRSSTTQEDQLSSSRKGLGLAVIAALAVLAPSVPAASAAITQSSASIDAPFGFNDETVPLTPPARTVTATSDGTQGDMADVLCLYGTTTAAELATDVTIGAGGAVTAQIDESTISTNYCRVIVVDANSGRPADDSPFQGPWIGGGDYSLTRDGSLVTDFYASGGWKGTYADFHSVGYGGMYDMALRNSAGETGPEIFYYNGFFESGETHPDGNGGSRPDVLVDGKHAYTAYEASQTPTNDGQPSITVDHSFDPATGNITIHEAEDLVFCAPDEATCTSFVPSGLRFERTLATSHEGQVVNITDTVRNTGAADHTFDFEYQEFNNFSGHTGFRLPGESGYSAHPEGDVKTGLGPISTIGIDYDTTNGFNGVGNPLGAITFSPAPTRLLFGRQHAGTATVSSGFWVGFKDTIPAGGSKTITQDYVMSARQDEIDSITGAREDSLAGPSVAITDPAADGSAVSTPAITVKGTASDNKAVASLKVNGADVAVAADGTWSAAVTLAEGANTVTAVAKDAAGNQATASRTVTYVKPVPPPPVVTAATVTRSGKVTVTRKGSKVLVDTGIKVTCPAGGLPCTAAASAKTLKAVAAKKVHKSKVTIASKTFKIAAGKTQKIVLTLSSKGAKALKRNKKLTVRVTVVAKVGNNAAKTTTRTITIKQPKAAKKHHKH